MAAIRSWVTPTLLAMVLVGCATSQSPSTEESVTSPPRIHQGYATGFEKGYFVRDVRPLESPDSTDLRELAMTLPILESPDALEWYYQNSSPAVTEERWRLPADGAQASVLLERLPRAVDGAQRIRLTIYPIPLGAPPKGYRYVSELERREGGWMILESEETRTL